MNKNSYEDDEEEIIYEDDYIGDEEGDDSLADSTNYE